MLGSDWFLYGSFQSTQAPPTSFEMAQYTYYTPRSPEADSVPEKSAKTAQVVLHSSKFRSWYLERFVLT